jgi:hypothetical protein
MKDMRTELYRAAISCGHEITHEQIILYVDSRKEGNALSQLADRLEQAALSAVPNHIPDVGEMVQPAKLEHHPICDGRYPALCKACIAEVQQPAKEAGNCDECGKSQSEGFALYCVKCIDVISAKEKSKPESLLLDTTNQHEASSNLAIDIHCNTHEFSLEPSSGIELCVKCGLSKMLYKKSQAQQPAQEPMSEAVPWTYGANEFKDWCSHWFGVDADESYLSKAIHDLPPMAQNFKRSIFQEPVKQESKPIIDDIQSLVDASVMMLEWCVKNVKAWNFSEYDWLHRSTERVKKSLPPVKEVTE